MHFQNVKQLVPNLAIIITFSSESIIQFDFWCMILLSCSPWPRLFMNTYENVDPSEICLLEPLIKFIYCLWQILKHFRFSDLVKGMIYYPHTEKPGTSRPILVLPLRVKNPINIRLQCVMKKKLRVSPSESMFLLCSDYLNSLVIWIFSRLSNSNADTTAEEGKYIFTLMSKSKIFQVGKKLRI